MNIVIIGQGAIGLLWYFKLSKIGTHHVTLVSSTNSQLPKSPSLLPEMSLTDLDNNTEHLPLFFAKDEDLNNADLVIFCLKAYDINKAYQQYKKNIARSAIVVFSHNGVVNAQDLSNDDAKETAQLLMLTTHGSLRERPFHIRHTGQGQSDIGILRGSLPADMKNQLLNLLNLAITDVCWQKNIIEKQWHKLAINCVINPLTAIHNVNNGELVSTEYHHSVHNILKEIVMVASANNIHLSESGLFKLVINVAEKTAINCSSMRSDILAKRKTEINFINGYIHQQGLKHTIATPHNTELWQRVTEMEK